MIGIGVCLGSIVAMDVRERLEPGLGDLGDVLRLVPSSMGDPLVSGLVE